MFSRPSAFSSTQRMERSSSMIQTAFMVCRWAAPRQTLVWPARAASFGHPVFGRRGWGIRRSSVFLFLSGHRQHQRKTGATGARSDFNGSAVLLDEALGDGEAQAAAVLTTRHQRIEDLVANVFRYARSVVDHLQFKCQLVVFLGQ